MRTTVTLDPDAEQIVRSRMRDRKVSFKQALNDTIREGGSPPEPPYRAPIIDMGLPLVDLDKALHLLGDLEDEEVIRKMRSGR